jgi:hypothetical protein
MHTRDDHRPAGCAALTARSSNTPLANPAGERAAPPRRAAPLHTGRSSSVGSDEGNDLVRRAKAGDLGAFEALVTRHERQVYTLASRITSQEHDAKDVTQQTFLSALENLAGFREESSFCTGLLRTATHAALNVLRKRKGMSPVSLEETTELQ